MTDQGTWDFGVLLASIADGELRDEVSDELHLAVEKLYDRARAGRKSVKGTLTIALDIKVTELGLVTIEPDVKTALPRKTRRETPMWVGRHGLTQDNPKQQKLEFREIGGGRVITEPGARAEAGE